MVCRILFQRLLCPANDSVWTLWSRANNFRGTVRWRTGAGIHGRTWQCRWGETDTFNLWYLWYLWFEWGLIQPRCGVTGGILENHLRPEAFWQDLQQCDLTNVGGCVLAAVWFTSGKSDPSNDIHYHPLSYLLDFVGVLSFETNFVVTSVKSTFEKHTDNGNHEAHSLVGATALLFQGQKSQREPLKRLDPVGPGALFCATFFNIDHPTTGHHDICIPSGS